MKIVFRHGNWHRIIEAVSKLSSEGIETKTDTKADWNGKYLVWVERKDELAAELTLLRWNSAQ